MTLTLIIFVGLPYSSVGEKKWIPNKIEDYNTKHILDSPDSFLWSIFISQPNGTEQAVAGKKSRTVSPTAKITRPNVISDGSNDQMIRVD